MVIVSFIALFYMQSLASAQWESVTTPDVGPVWSVRAVTFPSVDEGWAVGAVTQAGQKQTGLILHYSDDVWSVATPTVSSEWYLEAVAFPSADEGWAVGWDYTNGTGVMLHYSSGSGWISMIPAGLKPGWYITSLSFPSADEGWAVGWNSNSTNIILHYSGGVWNSVTPPPSGSYIWYLYGVSFPSSDQGWAVGVTNKTGGGLILHYSGGVWSEVTPPTVSSDWVLKAVSFPSVDEGWAVGWDNKSHTGVMLQYSSESGWSVVTLPEVSSDWVLEAVSFPSVDEGWAVGLDSANGVGVILHYYYGSWSSETPPDLSFKWGLAGLFFLSVDEGWAVGGETVPGTGVILHYLVNKPAPVIDKPTVGAVTTTTAVLGATIESNGGYTITAAGIAYGQSSNPGPSGKKVTTTVKEGAFKITVTGLTSNTLYHFRGYATNASPATDYTTDMTFTTIAAAPKTTAATNISATGFTANWSTPSGTAKISHYLLDVATDSDFSHFVSGYKSLPVSKPGAKVTGLTAGKTYYYRVRTVNAGGTSAYSNSKKVVLPSIPSRQL